MSKIYYGGGGMKKKSGFIMGALLAVLLLLTTGCDLTGAYVLTYAIGDTGPAGGLIFYIDTADEHPWTYLEVAPQSTEWTSKEWGDYGTQIGGDAALTGIGDGQAATTAIVSHMEGQTITGTAAQLCDGLSHNSFEDWFLPSQDELNAIRDNIVDDGSGANSGVGGFANEDYWSSSELNSLFAWTQSFGSGSQDDASKLYTTRVRAVRAF